MFILQMEIQENLATIQKKIQTQIKQCKKNRNFKKTQPNTNVKY